MTKNILVIGGTGFVGKNLFDTSAYQYKEDTNYYFISRKNDLPYVLPNTFLLNYNYFNEEHLNSIFQNYKFDEVWHLLSTSVPSTSQILLEFSIQNDLLYLIKLLNLMKENNVKKIIFLSSGGTVYSGISEINNQEDLIPTPFSPYGILKTAMEHYIKYFHQNYGINYTILRVSNLFGPNHNSVNNGLINISIRKYLNKEELNILGDGSVTKDFLFVSDFAKIYWLLISSEDSLNMVINVGSGILYSIKVILDKLKKKLPNLLIKYSNTDTIVNSCSEFSVIKLKSLIQFETKKIDIAIDETIEWEIQNFKIKQ